jgi:hypothetical protein
LAKGNASSLQVLGITLEIQTNITQIYSLEIGKMIHLQHLEKLLKLRPQFKCMVEELIFF